MKKETDVAFLLAQLGAYAAARFAERAAELDFTPPQTGLLRLIARRPGQSQQAIAKQLGTPPSRLVRLVDGLEERDLVERRRNPDDRRHHALYLTETASHAMARLSRAAADHENAVCGSLTAAERAQLHGLLGRLAAEHGLTPGVHPGYRALGRSDEDLRETTVSPVREPGGDPPADPVSRAGERPG